jgi:hypothetical protein
MEKYSDWLGHCLQRHGVGSSYVERAYLCKEIPSLHPRRSRITATSRSALANYPTKATEEMLGAETEP